MTPFKHFPLFCLTFGGESKGGGKLRTKIQWGLGCFANFQTSGVFEEWNRKETVEYIKFDPFNICTLKSYFQ